MTRVVLVGGGVATAAAVAGLRAGGFDGEIVLVAAEPTVPYERPPLSKEYLSGAFGLPDFEVNAESWYEQNAVELVLGTRAEKLEPAEREVLLSDRRTLGYDALVLATGVRARTLPGFAGERVHGLRTIADSERLGARLSPGTHLGVLGAGFIGCEVAAVAAARGVRVTIFDPNPAPLAAALGPEVATAVLGIHQEQGVLIRAGVGVTAMSEHSEGVELRTTTGELVHCDELLVGVGSVPNTELAVEAGITVDGGVVTDEHGRTDVEQVYAIGDVAARWSPRHGRHIRVEHHDTAVRHGTNVARNLLGHEESFDAEHFFWTHQYDHQVQSIGQLGTHGTRVVRGSMGQRSFSVFSLVDGRIESMVSLNRPRDLLRTRKAMAVAHTVTAQQLADEDFPLESLVPKRTRTRRSEVSG